MRGTGVPEAVDTDLANIQREYTDVVLPFIAKHLDLWNPDTHTLELYTQLVAFVMAYRSVNVTQNTHSCRKHPDLLFFTVFLVLSVVSRSRRKRRTKTKRRMMKRRRRPPTHR